MAEKWLVMDCRGKMCPESGWHSKLESTLYLAQNIPVEFVPFNKKYLGCPQGGRRQRNIGVAITNTKI